MKQSGLWVSNWFDSVVKQYSEGKIYENSENEPLLVTGKIDQHLGPRFQIACVEFEISKAEQEFLVTFEKRINSGESLVKEYAVSAVFGFLDCFLIDNIARDSTAISIHVKNLEIDDDSSSVMAFRLAGRQAAQEYIKRREQLSFNSR